MSSQGPCCVNGLTFEIFWALSEVDALACISKNKLKLPEKSWESEDYWIIYFGRKKITILGVGIVIVRKRAIRFRCFICSNKNRNHFSRLRELGNFEIYCTQLSTILYKELSALGQIFYVLSKIWRKTWCFFSKTAVKPLTSDFFWIPLEVDGLAYAIRKNIEIAKNTKRMKKFRNLMFA